MCFLEVNRVVTRNSLTSDLSMCNDGKVHFALFFYHNNLHGRTVCSRGMGINL